ncbi:MAG: zinc metallopeptidase, partial [Eubacterium sp.]|nr:zinc metallopeptidase [Eubacterium sp.]
LSFRTTLVPVAKFGSAASWFFILGGILFGFGELITVGIVLFSAAVLFQLVTLPVEFNASKRALVVLQETGILAEQEKSGAKSVLSAAALTYVASAAAAILSLLRLIILFGRKND